MLDVLRSRWRTQLSWRYAIPERSCRMRHFTSATVNGCRIESIKAFKSCSINSITMKMLSSELPTTTSETLTMFGCLKLSKMLISRSDVIGKPSRSFSILTFFSAFTSPERLSRARNTTPYVPSSMWLSFSNSFTLRQLASIETVPAAEGGGVAVCEPHRNLLASCSEAVASGPDDGPPAPAPPLAAASSRRCSSPLTSLLSSLS
mmetsp:Transcript_29599/g.96400  ORF Transcript_29599/g.96400 Transcript_29599/m.96400 type:complete len:205 (+) Transcript_29599:1330-1944(+)